MAPGCWLRLPASGARLLRSDIKTPFRWCPCATLGAEGCWPLGAAGPGGGRAAPHLGHKPQLPWPSCPPAVSLHLGVKRKHRGQEVDHRREASGTSFPCSASKPLLAPWLCSGRVGGGGGFLLLPLPSETLSLVPPDRRLPWRDSAQSPGEKFSWRGESPAGGLVRRGWTSLHICTCIHTHSHTGAHPGRGEPGRG